MAETKNDGNALVRQLIKMRDILDAYVETNELFMGDILEFNRIIRNIEHHYKNNPLILTFARNIRRNLGILLRHIEERSTDNIFETRKHTVDQCELLLEDLEKIQ